MFASFIIINIYIFSLFVSIFETGPSEMKNISTLSVCKNFFNFQSMINSLYEQNKIKNIIIHI